MLWIDDENHSFFGIGQKLKRAYENILNLNSEIGTFFKSSKYPILPDTKSKEWQEAVDYHRDLAIPKRFSVLSGEIIHHLRSCLDHITWHFSSTQYRIDSENAIEFPVFREEPLAKEEVRRYNRKVKGISNPEVLKLIRDLQPYQRRGDPENDPICIVHDMDRFDKHRELAILPGCANVHLPPGVTIEVVTALTKYAEGELLTDAEIERISRTVKQDAKVMPQIAFARFGKGQVQFVVPALTQLHEAIRKRIDLFSKWA